MLKAPFKCRECGQTVSKNLLKLTKTGSIKDRVCKKCRLADFKQRIKERGYWNTKQYRKGKKSYCEKCGFKGHPCQLDVNHKDGNHKNDKEENRETLCANCHRIEGYLKKHGIYKYKNGVLILKGGE